MSARPKKGIRSDSDVYRGSVHGGRLKNEELSYGFDGK